MDVKLIIYTDGGARGNPGPAALGVVICDISGKVIKKIGKYLGLRTNNEAEYEAVIEALKLAIRLRARQVEINLDSELIVRQLNGIYRVKDRQLQERVLEVRNLETRFKKVSFHHIPREKNQLADQLVNKTLDKNRIS